MPSKIFTYPLVVKEIYLDVFGHINNAMYLTLYEEARWEVITKNGYGLDKIKETGKGPIILEIHLTYQKELRARDEIVIETQFLTYEKKIGTMVQRMKRRDEICSVLNLKCGLFSLQERKLILPTPEWIQAIEGKNGCYATTL